MCSPRGIGVDSRLLATQNRTVTRGHRQTTARIEPSFPPVKAIAYIQRCTLRPSEILSHAQTQPFQPIRIHISDGSSYDVMHPEMMAVTTRVVFIAQPPEVDGVPERSVYCDPLHITRIEPIDGAKPHDRGT